jgi:hypothetical protein
MSTKRQHEGFSLGVGSRLYVELSDSNTTLLIFKTDITVTEQINLLQRIILIIMMGQWKESCILHLGVK